MGPCAQYERTADYLQGIIGPLVAQYQQITQTGAQADQAAAVEGQLTWLCHIVAAIIRGRLNSSSAESQEPLDGILASGLLVLLTSTDSGFHATRYEELSRQRLDSALLVLFQAFRKVYIGEQTMHSSKVYSALSERLGLQNHLAVLSVMLEKIAKNLQSYRRACGPALAPDPLPDLTVRRCGIVAARQPCAVVSSVMAPRVFAGASWTDCQCSCPAALQVERDGGGADTRALPGPQ